MYENSISPHPCQHLLLFSWLIIVILAGRKCYLVVIYISLMTNKPSWVVKNLPAMQEPQETKVRYPAQKVPLEEGMATHSCILSWKIAWTKEPGGLQSMGSRRVGHDWPTSLSLFTFMHWRRKWQPTPVFLPGESHRGAWWAAIYGVAQSRTRLKRLSSSSSKLVFFFHIEDVWTKHFKPSLVDPWLLVTKNPGF